MIQGYDPRTGKPAGDPVPETEGAQVDAIAEAAAAACVPWEQVGAGQARGGAGGGGRRPGWSGGGTGDGRGHRDRAGDGQADR